MRTARSRWTDEAVLRESGRWVHVPVAATVVDDGDRPLVHPPAFRGTSRVWRSWPAQDRAQDLILKTIRDVRASGGERLVWHTGDAVSPPFMDEFLSRHGFEKTEDLEVLAFELGDGPRPMLPRLGVPAEVRVTLARNEAELREAHAIASRVFPNSPALSEPEIGAYLRGVEHLTHEPGDGDADRTLRFLARPPDPTRERSGAVATAGAQVAVETVRLWGPQRSRSTGDAAPMAPWSPRDAASPTPRHPRPYQGERGNFLTPAPERRVSRGRLRTPPRIADLVGRHHEAFRGKARSRDFQPA